MTTVRLAFNAPTTRRIRSFHKLVPEPAWLVSYHYWSTWINWRDRIPIRDYVLDSGAYSAMTQGVEIDLQKYINFCKFVSHQDPLCSEIYALDVIGDWQESKKNCNRMVLNGIDAIPCYHFGEPMEVLKELAQEYPKIALGGCARKNWKTKLEWAKRCFDKVYPKKIHGFGFGAKQLILALPFHSVDSSSWGLGPMQFGRWKAFDGDYLSLGGPGAATRQDLAPEIRYYLDIEKLAQHKWAKEMALLEDLNE